MMTMVTTMVTMMTKIMTMMRDKNAKLPKYPKRYQVKDHQDDCNDNSNVGDDRVLKMTVIVMTTTMTTSVMTMMTTIGVQGCISCGILVSGIQARGVSSEHMENMEMFSCSPT